MKKQELVRALKKAGIKIPIPRHREINEYTARGILESAGLK